MTKPDEAERCYNAGFSCSQAVFSVFCEDEGLDRAMALKLSCGLGGGMARTGNVCGAVSGAILVIGLKCGKSTEDGDPAREKTYSLVQQFIADFLARNGSIQCRDLLGYDLSVPAEFESARNANLFRTKCPCLTRHAVEILERILPEEK